MNSSHHTNAKDLARQCQRVYRQRFTGKMLLVGFLFLLMLGTFTFLGREEKLGFWPSAMLQALVGFFLLCLVLLRDVTVDARAQVVREAWRLFGRLTVWERQRSLRQFGAVRSQRVEVVNDGNRRVYCEVYLVAGAGAGKRLNIERLEMREEGGSPEGIAVGRDLALLTGLPFEDKC